jgi:hypothetical protein
LRTQRELPLLPAEARAIAKEGYVYGFPLVDNYRIQYAYFVDGNNREYKGKWNEIHNTARVYTSDDRVIQTPNSDTPFRLCRQPDHRQFTGQFPACGPALEGRETGRR